MITAEVSVIMHTVEVNNCAKYPGQRAFNLLSMQRYAYGTNCSA